VVIRMSYDLQIWSVRPAAASDVLPNPTTWIATAFNILPLSDRYLRINNACARRINGEI
jgi:hypothetical protein